MEFKARYELIGIFTLAVVAMLFGFVYWLNNGAAQGHRTPYQVQFQGPVSGLQVGGGVFFNGLRVGEVTRLFVDPQKPALLNALISVNSDIPLRRDTRIGVDYQGLTGIAGISLAGGSPEAPLIKSTSDHPGLLIAGADAVNSFSRSAALASKVLSQLSDILGENRQSLKDTMDNLASFSKSLGGNKERVENILNGLERMTGGKGKKTGLVYDLQPPTGFTPPAVKPSWRLVISDPAVLLALNTDRIQFRPSDGESRPIKDARWSDNLPNLLQEKIIQSYENAGYAESVLRPLEGEDTDHKLLLDIRGFHLYKSKEQPQLRAKVEFMVKLVDGEGKVIASRLVNSTVPARGSDGKDAAIALGKAFSQCAIDLIDWSVKLLQG